VARAVLAAIRRELRLEPEWLAEKLPDMAGATIRA
jgi:hypothetical protein